MADNVQARLTIDLDALAHNHAVLRREAGGAEVAPVVKADGYGLGATPIARRLWSEGARSFFVARLDEGEALRAALGPERQATIYLLDGLADNAASRLAQADLTPVLSSVSQVHAARAWRAAGAGRRPMALQVDTGMNRQGLTAEEVQAAMRSGGVLTDLDIGLVMSHLGSASEPDDIRNANQLAQFLEVRGLFPKARASLAASAGIFLGGDYRFDLVRPGVSLYGGGPLERPDARLRAVATLSAPVLDVRDLRPGDRVGYGANIVVQRQTRAAIVAAGYADGVIRASRRGYCWLAGARRPLFIVNMDLLAVDIGDAEVRVGEVVELLGSNALLDDLASAAGTVAHEVLVRLSRRAERTYLGES